MFGIDPRKRRPFGASETYGTPGIGDGIGQHAYAQAPQQPERPKADKTRRIIGILGDALLGLGGQQGIYGPMMAQRRAQEEQYSRQQQLAQQSRQWGNEDWMQRQQWERDNPKPVNNDTINDVHWYMKASPEEKAAYDALHPINKIGPDGLPYPVPRSQLMPPTRPVGRLTPTEPTMQNTPAPQLGANGMPTAISRQQYQAIVAAKGQQATDEWARRNNITIGN